MVAAAAAGGWRGGLKFVGGTKTEELIAGCERGILVTHFFYIRFLDQRTVLLTGLTRDGTFLIENGQDHAGAEELPLEREPAVHAEQDRGDRPAERTAAGQMMPALRVKDFNFSSLSDAV